jgi:hypothetical protein
VANPKKDLPHHARFFLYKVIAGTASSVVFAYIPIAIRGATQHVDVADVGRMAFAPATALQNLGPFIFGHHPLDL